MKKFKIDRIISIATLVASLIAIILVLKKPAPVAHSQAPAAIAEHADSFDHKMAEFEQATQQSQSSGSYESKPETGQAAAPAPRAEVHINSEDASGDVAHSLGNAGGAALTP